MADVALTFAQSNDQGDDSASNEHCSNCRRETFTALCLDAEFGISDFDAAFLPMRDGYDKCQNAENYEQDADYGKSLHRELLFERMTY